MTPQVSVVIVNYNGRQFLPRVMQCLAQQTLPAAGIDIILLDTGSSDGSLEFVQQQYPQVRAQAADRNNFARALNTGTALAHAPLVLFLNNDMYLDPPWLERAVRHFEQEPKCAGLQGKIFFERRRGILNSCGCELDSDFYGRDVGFSERDSGQYDAPAPRKAVTNGCAIYRKAALDAIGGVDEDYVMYAEDIDLGFRLTEAGGELWFYPDLVSYHEFHGTASSQLCARLMNRNRFLWLARHRPDRFVEMIPRTHAFITGERYTLLWSLAEGVVKLFKAHGAKAEPVARAAADLVIRHFGFDEGVRLVTRVRRWLSKSPHLEVGIYDRAFHYPGGGQKYFATIADWILERHPVRYLVNKPIDLDRVRQWYHLPLKGATVETIELPPFADSFHIDPTVIRPPVPNIFTLVSERSEALDVFVNANMVAHVYPRAAFSIFACHFPEFPRDHYFFADKYDWLIASSRFCESHLFLRWGLLADFRLYPPVDFPPVERGEKQPLIIAIGRFERAGHKKQLECVEAFVQLDKRQGVVKDGWRLAIAGGANTEDPYYRRVVQRAQETRLPITVDANVPQPTIAELYRNAGIFWNLTGLGETDPRLTEHFGMTTVEAMQNGAVPIVFNGGGLSESVDHGDNGYLFNSTDDLLDRTQQLIRDPALRARLGADARRKAQDFTKEAFLKQFSERFLRLEQILLRGPQDVPDIALLYKL